MSIPEDPTERKKWMLKLWQEYGERFAVFHPDEQPVPPTEVWHPDMYEPYEPEPDQDGRLDPRVIRHLRWWADTKEFLRHRFGLQVSPDYLFDCLAGKHQGRFSDQVDEKVEKRWYVRALRMGAFMYDGKVGVGFSCRSRRCQRIKCPLNLQRKKNDQKRLNRVDLFELLQIFYGEQKMPLSKAVREVSAVFDLRLHDFGSPHYAVPKEAFVRLLDNYRDDAAKLIKNFRNRCMGKRSHLVYFTHKPPPEISQKYVCFPQSMVAEGTLERIDHPAVTIYLHLLVVRVEAAIANRAFRIPSAAEIESETAARGYKISRRSAKRYLEHLESVGLLSDKNPGENV
ncbi:MAG: hypothetical protein HY912_14800 [Desulfomonile tiedjei]|uniref:Uncharacterized protein n=1 Tax=Desulfomonile tiedjei TaxID=2358 RepID=A0A9D6V3E5_9BACT|nr:hypothetical protein [Desulfomonile tiedjei]